jgi:hypothetical protein
MPWLTTSSAVAALPGRNGAAPGGVVVSWAGRICQLGGAFLSVEGGGGGVARTLQGEHAREVVVRQPELELLLVAELWLLRLPLLLLHHGCIP